MVAPCHVQAHLHAHELTLAHAADDPAKLTRALVEAQVDLNPHQVDAALFAFQNPLSKGAILADEVGLGKTIEAGLVATQHWAEEKRRILVLCPASLRTQWRDELHEKFFLPSTILDAKALAAAPEAGNPFDRGTGADAAIVIVSYHFAAKRQELLMTVPWDLAILDEAHRLRNVYKGARIGERIKAALATAPKVLLTATPLQNSLLELYGLVSLIDDEAFGDQRTFTRKYSRIGEEGERFEELRERLAPICHRTLRRQVVEYVSYTRREPLTQKFWPTDDEQRLYDLVSEYLRRERLLALPNAQRSLITLVLRKLLASSTFAIAGALDTMVRRLTRTLRDGEAALATVAVGVATGPGGDVDVPAVDDELVDELVEEELDGALTADDVSELTGEPDEQAAVLSRAELDAIAAEIADLESFRDLAQEITENAKGEALLTALATAFERAAALGAARKAVVFTESRRTQDYLVRLLEANGHAGKVVRFSGTNSDPVSAAVYGEWRRRHAGSDRVTGSRAIDIRAALADTFRTSAEIMIATEAAAEGINLQFCSIVVNYDLPWNPQRVEQRIGRCHRYGQRNDVLVVNFLNQENAADQRVYELLDQKFKLFEGVFGASDEVLGSIESGVNIERRIGEIYQRCRTREEIDRDFEQLRLDFADEIDSAMKRTRTKLIEHFDAQVHDRLRLRLDASSRAVSRHQDLLFRVMRYALGDRARFDAEARRFTVDALPDGLPLETPRDYAAFRPGPDDRFHYLRPNDPVARWALGQALLAPLEGLHVTFDYGAWEVTAAELAPLVGRSGVLRAVKLRIAGKDVEEHLLLAGAADDGEALTDAQMRRLMDVPASERREGVGELASAARDRLDALQAARLADFEERRASWLGGEYDKLESWAQDERDRLRAEVDEIEKQIKQCARDVRAAGSEAERLPLRRHKLTLERRRDEARRDYDDAAARIDERQQAMLDEIETALDSQHSADTLFTIRWSVR